jgi:hypothetical protein
VVGLLVIVALMTASQASQTSYAYPDIDFKGALARSVFTYGRDTLTSGDLAVVKEPLRERLSRYLIRRSAFKSSYGGKAADFDTAAIDAKRRVIERAIVALIERQGIAQRAVDFVKDAPIAYEWEGMPDGPEAEAAYAEAFLRNDPATPLAPFIHVFVAHRERAAFEACEREKKIDCMKKTAAAYREALQRGRSASDPMFRLVADDLDRAPYVYLKTAAHPRSY